MCKLKHSGIWIALTIAVATMICVSVFYLTHLDSAGDPATAEPISVVVEHINPCPMCLEKDRSIQLLAKANEELRALLDDYRESEG